MNQTRSELVILQERSVSSVRIKVYTGIDTYISKSSAVFLYSAIPSIFSILDVLVELREMFETIERE